MHNWREQTLESNAANQFTQIWKYPPPLNYLRLDLNSKKSIFDNGKIVWTLLDGVVFVLKQHMLAFSFVGSMDVDIYHSFFNLIFLY